MKEAHEHAAALLNERRSRATGLHADDKRIATEIAAHQFDLAQMAKALRDQNERWRVGSADNVRTLEEIETIYTRLQTEMDIATHRRSVV